MEIDDRRVGRHKRYDMVLAHDTFMSGWGRAKGGESYVAWSAEPAYIQAVKEWVEKKPEMKHVRIVPSDWVNTNKNVAHLSIHMVDDYHPAITDQLIPILFTK